MTKLTLQLEKMTCPSCMKKITNHVDALDGVEKMKILFSASKGRVLFDEAILSENKIIEEIETIGYTAKKIK